MYRLLRKAAILGLAAFGAYRVYELVRPKAEQLAGSAGPQLSGAMDTVSSTAAKVKDDVTSARDDVVSDLKDDVTSARDDVVSDLKGAVDEQRDRLSSTTASTPVDTEAPQVGLG